MSIGRAIYSVCTLAASIVALPFFALHPRGRKRLGERLGAWNLSGFEGIWFHGASAGEVQGLLPVISSLRASGAAPVLVTATSVTGLDGIAALGAELRILPFDHPWFIRRALRGMKPSKLVIGETELWPNLLHELARRSIPAFLVNARISSRSTRRYGYVRSIVQRALRSYRWILAANEASRARLLELGADPSRITVGGNAKYDRAPSLQGKEAIARERESLLLSPAPVLVLGSIRPGEEAVWFPAIRAARESGMRLTVFVVPRHREKFEFFAEQLRDGSVPFERWSELTLPRGRGEDTVLVDAFGQLERLYAVADVAFIGATLVPIGGHNPLEACAYGACVAIGPHTEVVDDVVEALEREAAVVRVRTEDDCRALLQKLWADPESIRAVGMRGNEVWSTFRGATARIVSLLEDAR